MWESSLTPKPQNTSPQKNSNTQASRFVVCLLTALCVSTLVCAHPHCSFPLHYFDSLVLISLLFVLCVHLFTKSVSTYSQHLHVLSAKITRLHSSCMFQAVLYNYMPTYFTVIAISLSYFDENSTAPGRHAM